MNKLLFFAAAATMFAACSTDTTICYTAINDKPISVHNINGFGANIISNTYENGIGKIVFDGNITTIPNYAFEDCVNLTNITIPNNVTLIGKDAFKNCHSLINITIPNSVTSIEETAFWYCSNLKSVIIGDSVTSIGSYAFYGCSSLTAFHGKYASVDNRCLVKNGKLIVCAPYGLTEYFIPSDVTSIGIYAFGDCRSLTNIIIPNSITSIEDGAFNNCSSLTAFYGKYASADNRCWVQDGRLVAFAPYGLTEYVIPDNVTSIVRYAFTDCRNLTNITIPDSVDLIGMYEFSDCSSLTSIYCKSIVPPALGYKAFIGISSSAKIYVPTVSVNAYKSAGNWSNFADKIAGYDF